MKSREDFATDFSVLCGKYQASGFAYAIVFSDKELDMLYEGYGASFPTGTEEGLIKKLQIITSDIKKSLKNEGRKIKDDKTS